MVNKRLISDIKKSLDKRDKREADLETRTLKSTRFLVDLFNEPNVRKLLQESRAEILLYEHYDNPLSAGLTGKNTPDYQVVISNEGIVEKVKGKVANKKQFPACIENWKELNPYGKDFGDERKAIYEPHLTEYFKGIENQVKRLVK